MVGFNSFPFVTFPFPNVPRQNKNPGKATWDTIMLPENIQLTLAIPFPG
jgi:hypothetical protein